jgi:1-deoxy-D-xylulose-5-phosphate synthase
MEENPILPNIKSPGDLRALPKEKLPRLAAEIRETLIETVSRTGGHLASNLGVVELTMALHLCFESPRDALVWDVSHQCYTHKLLTGRYGRFHTLRQSHGLSGFTCPEESAHDLFAAGHASASVSSALGLAEAKRLQGDPHFAVAILGDGALTGGLAYEALNNAGHSRARLIVVLNDNEMSISRNVGGLSRYLALVRARPEYRKTKRRVERALRKIPLIGDALAAFFRKTKRFIKRILTNTTIFEDLGLAYIGPVDGHDVDRLCAALESAKLAPRPALVHVRTVKGKGFDFAEQSPERFHGVGRFDPEAGALARPENSYADVLAQELCRLAREDPSICAVTAAMAAGTGLDIFAGEFPGRCFDVGIAEAHAVTFAAGLARQGLRPVVALYSTFLQRAYDQLLHDAALQKLPIVVAVDHAGFVGADGATHHGLYDAAFCASIPGSVVDSPATAQDLRDSLRRAFANGGLTFIRYPHRRVFPQHAPPPLRAGSQFSLYGDAASGRAVVTYGRLLFAASQAKNAKILQLKRILPIAPAAVESVLGCARVVFLEEGLRTGGVGERFGLHLLERRFRGEYILKAVDGFARHAPVEELLAEHGLGLTE